MSTISLTQNIPQGGESLFTVNLRYNRFSLNRELADNRNLLIFLSYKYATDNNNTRVTLSTIPIC